MQGENTKKIHQGDDTDRQEKFNNNNNNCKKKNKGKKEDSNTIAAQFCHWIRYHTETIIGRELERNQYITIF